MLGILATSLMTATRTAERAHPETTEWDRERALASRDQLFWWGRRLRHPDGRRTQV